MIRSLIVVLLVALGGLLSVPAALAVWQEREIQDEDRFIATTDEVFSDPDVQVALANRLTDALMTRADIQGRISAGLQDLENRESGRVPQGIALLEGPLTRVARESINQAILRTLQAQPLKDQRETALRALHRALIAVIKQEGPLEVEGSKVVLDLQPLIVNVVNELAGERGTEFLQNLNLPPDTGKVVVTEEANHPRLWTLARWVDDINPIVPIIAVAILLLGVVISRNRRRTLISAGLTVALVAGLAILALAGPLQGLATSWPATPEGQTAAESVYDILTDSFRKQEIFVVLLGLAIAGGGSIAGDERFKSALRSTIRGSDRTGKPFIDWVRARATVLRMAGLGVGALFLILWPDPATRLTITVLVIVGLYLAALWVLTSDASWATRVRQQAASYLEPKSDGKQRSPDSPASAAAGWVARWAGWLRLLGIILAVILIVSLPFSYGIFLAIIALLLLYLAAIDFAANSVD